MNRRRQTLCMLALAIAAASHRLAAHDLERTAVSLTFARDGSFVLDVANDPNWLLLRLESFGGNQSPRSVNPDPGSTAVPIVPVAERDVRLRALAPVFVDRIVLFVDGKEVRPNAVEYLAPQSQTPIDSPTPSATFRLRGRVDPDAHILRWYYGMVVDPYPLTIHRADGRVVNEWIVAGDAWSRVEDLSGQFVRPTFFGLARQYLALGYTRILPNGLEHVLFLLAVFLFGPELRFVVRQIVTFSAACATSLALAAFGVVTAAPRGFAVFLALSVVYVALDNLADTPLKRARVAFVGLFGLLYGVALAGALQSVEPPPRALPLAVAWFYLGVVGAQLTTMALASACVTWSRNQAWYHQRIVVPSSFAIAALGIYWAVIRTIA